MAGSDSYGFSCSHTTRAPREGEENGKEYWFTTKEKFEKGIEEGKFLEYAYVHSNIYGTSLKAVQDVAAAGRCCVLDIDVQGARLVRRSGLKAIFVFVAPPNSEELERRLRGRGTETDEQVAERLAAAKQEIASIKEPGLYDYIIFNDDVEEAFRQLASVAERALRGQVGNGSGPGSGVVTLVADEDAAVGGAAAANPDPNPAHDGAAGHAETAPLLGGAAGTTEGGNPKQNPATSAASSGSRPPAPPAPAAATTRSEATPAPVLERWRGKVALVTGASAGIGWATCTALARAGLRVVAVARRRERLEALQQAVVAGGVPITEFLPVVCDITKEAEVVALPRIIAKRWPGAGVDVLVNNAGLGRNNAALWDGATSSWVEMVSTNVLGVCMCTREALQDMKKRGEYGHVINISSMSGHRVPPGGHSFYAATKHALRALTEGLRQEARVQGADLRVTAISPGMVETEFAAVAAFGDTQEGAAKYKEFQCLQAEDVAAAVVYALSAPPHVDVNDILMRPVQQKT
ncbi:hypothetical protein WJX81_008303 [Elliptochloris bilobata]|uniref:guanylate kinase n=1 Tax=Elliptochloris bilobata TaxID=381761 RepID=A0AAW1R9X2_9CHLO